MSKRIRKPEIVGEITEVIVSTSQAAAILGVSTVWVRQLQKEGWVKPVGRGKWKLVDLVAGRSNQLKDLAEKANKTSVANRATEARTKEIEHRIARQEGKFVPVAEFHSLFDEIIGEFLTALSSLPLRITREKRERDRIDTIVDQERDRLTKIFGKKAEALQSDR